MTTRLRGSFSYDNPRTIHWGAGCVAERLDDELRRLDSRRAFLIATRSVAANAALAPRLQEQLGERLVGCHSAIGEHAPAQDVAAAARAAREARPDVLISFGGGSPIDAAKAVAFALAIGLDLADPQAPTRARKLRPPAGAVLPHLAIPTTLSVAELSSSAGFSAEGSREKVGLRAAELMPAAVFYDAELAVHTPLDLWLASGIRAVDHAVEGIISPGSHPFSDALALEGLGRLKAGLLATKADPADREARTECQLGAWFCYTLPGPSMVGLSHTLGKRLGSRHGIPHGVTSCLLLPHVMRYLAPSNAPALARVGQALGVDIIGLSTAEAATRAAHAVGELIEQLGLPRSLTRYGLDEADLEEAVGPVVSEVYSEEDLLGILRAAM
jgi:alcohol dehydrogenase class IV